MELACQTVSTTTITVEPYLSVQNYEHFRRFVLSTNIPEFEFIDGFDFEWGYSYHLKVEVTKLVPELSDGTRYDFALEKVTSKTQVPDSTEFKLFIHPNRYYYQLPPEEEYLNTTLKSVDDSTYVYLEEVEIEVPEDLRDQFLQVANGHTGKLGKFRCMNTRRILFVGW